MNRYGLEKTTEPLELVSSNIKWEFYLPIRVIRIRENSSKEPRPMPNRRFLVIMTYFNP